METKRRTYSVAEVAGVRHLIRELRKAANRTSDVHRDSGTVAFCMGVVSLADALRDAINADAPITMFTATQPPLFDYSLTDEAYGRIK